MDFDESDRHAFGALRKGDVLICEGGEVDVVRLGDRNDELPECYFQKALHRVRPYPSVTTSEYIVNLFRGLAQRDVFLDTASKMTFSHLTGVKLNFGSDNPQYRLSHFRDSSPSGCRQQRRPLDNETPPEKESIRQALWYLRTRSNRNPTQPPQNPRMSPMWVNFRSVRLIGSRWQWWKRLFVTTVPARSKILSLDIPTVLTGPRGSGKTMQLRRLSERVVVECGEVSGLSVGRFAAFYVNCQRLRGCLCEISGSPGCRR